MKTKRILSIFMSLIMVMIIIPISGITASAAVWSGDFEYWVDNNDNAHICGFNDSYLGEVKIPSTFTFYGKTYPIKYIDEEAFLHNNYITSVEIPSSIIKIDTQAFYDCYSLEEIVFNEGLEEIGIEAFYNCSDLKSVTFPTTLKEIKNSAFYSCDSLSTVTINHEIERIGLQAFAYCGSLSKIVLKQIPKAWGTNAFNYGHDKTFYIPCNIYVANFEDAVENQEWNASIVRTHENTTLVNIPATCSENGYNNREVCDDCKKVIKNGTIVPKLPHTPVAVAGKPATYFSNGLTGGNSCSVCKTKIVIQKTIYKLKLKTPVFKLTKGNKQFKVKYTKVKAATGFEVRYKIKGSWITKTFNSKKTATKVVKKLSAGTYKVQIRAFIKQNGKTAYSYWTTTKTVKVK